MKILLTNDDGIWAKGLLALYNRFRENHDVTVVAPDRERSAVGHAITLKTPLRVAKVSLNNGDKGYAVNGTPADCIKLSIMELLDSKPDMIISGINPGANVGINVHYSGTVAAAREAALYDIPSLAVSIDGFKTKHYTEAAFFTETLSAKIMEHGLPPKTFLNVNIPDMPAEQTAGVIIGKQSLLPLDEAFEKRNDPRDYPYFWHSCELPKINNDLDVDQSIISNNYISITPIRCDTTAHGFIEELKGWNI